MSDNPYESPKRDTGAAKARSPLLLIGKIVVGVAAVLLVAAFFLPAIRTARPAARRAQCINNLKQITIALHKYESDNGALPPAYTVDGEGNRLHSWRTLILPYTDEPSSLELYKAIDLSKPWDDPANAKARETVMQMYQCPSFPGQDGLTTYLAVVGPDCVFSGSVPRKLSEVTDGEENTIAVIDADSDRAVHWMSPNDVSEDVFLEYGPESRTNHVGIIVAGFLDAHVDTIQLESDPDDRRAMLTIAGGEPIAAE